MKILHINTNDLRGGAAKVMNRLINDQITKGHEVKALVYEKESNYSYSYPFDRIEHYSYKDVALAEGMLDYHYFGAFHLVDNPIFQEADVVHLHNIHGDYFNPYALSVISHLKPVVWTLHDMQSVTGHCAYAFDCTKWELGCNECPSLAEYPAILADRTLLNWQEKQDIYNHSKLFIVPVAKWIENIADSGLLKHMPKQTIYNGVNMNTFKPMNKQAMRKKYGIPERKVVIGAVANGGAFTQERKGGKFVQQVVERLVDEGYDILLVNVGGSNKGYVSEHVYNVGYLTSDEQMAEVYNAFDIYLFPSLADTCPLVISEAMACQIPIVTFDTGGIAELVHHTKTGFVAPRGDAEQLYQYTLTLVKDANLRMSYAENALQHCQDNFEHDKVTDQYISVYEQAIHLHRQNLNDIKTFDISRVPSVIKESSLFKYTEQLKLNFELMSETYKVPKQEVYIISNRMKKDNSVLIDVTVLTFEEARSFSFRDNDIIYIDRDHYEISDNFFQSMLYKGLNTDVLTSKLFLLRSDGNLFYLRATQIIDQHKQVIDTAKGGTFYRGSFFMKHIYEILEGSKILFTSIEQFNTPFVKVKIDQYISSLINEPVYIYGAGSHTKDLLEQCPGMEQHIEGIIDSNVNLHGQYFLGQYEIISLKNIDHCIPILISSSSYEKEIYNRIKSEISNRIIMIYNN